MLLLTTNDLISHFDSHLDLQDIDHNDHNHGHQDRAHDPKEDHSSRQGQAQDHSGQDEEHDDQVEDRKPPVIGGGPTQDLAEGERPPHEGQRVEQQDPTQVEEQVAQGNLD